MLGRRAWARKTPRMADSSAGPPESWLRKMHDVCVYLSVWLCAETTQEM